MGQRAQWGKRDGDKVYFRGLDVARGRIIFEKYYFYRYLTSSIIILKKNCNSFIEKLSS